MGIQPPSALSTLTETSKLWQLKPREGVLIRQLNI